MVRDIYSSRYARLRKLLAQARKEAGLTQFTLAKKLDRPQSFIANVERGVRHVDIIEYLSIVEAIGINPHHIIDQLLIPTSDINA